MTIIYKRRFKESSLSRIWQHIIKPETSFGVISAFRGIYSDNENLQKHEELRKKIRLMGYGYIEQNSGYSYLNKQTGEEVPVDEKSFFIPNISFEDCIKIGRMFEQESVLYKDQEKGFGLFLCSNGNKIMTFKDKDKLFTFKKDDIKNAYSQLIKANIGQKVKFSYIAEHYIPSRADAYRSIGTGKLAESKWIKII
jgi:hypothetical protein